MSQLTMILWLLTVVVDTFGQLAFKAAAASGSEYSGFSSWKYIAKQPWLWIGVICYIFEFVLWLAFLSLVPLSIGVMLGSITIVTIMIAGRIWFNEKLTKWRIIGISLIAIGVAIVGLG